MPSQGGDAIRRKLEELFKTRILRAAEIVGDLAKKPEILGEARNRLEEASELLDWIGGAQLTAEELGEHLIKKWRYSYEQAEELVRQAYKRQRGRPSTTKEVGLKAEVMHRAGQSWTKIAWKLCKCGSETHPAECVQRIRQAALKARKFLTHYGL